LLSLTNTASDHAAGMLFDSTTLYLDDVDGLAAVHGDDDSVGLGNSSKDLSLGELESSGGGGGGGGDEVMKEFVLYILSMSVSNNLAFLMISRTP
jgi:hypothetical protein